MDDFVKKKRKNIESECLVLFDDVCTQLGLCSYRGQGANNWFDPPGFGLIGRQQFQFGDRRVDELADRIVILEVESGGGETNLVKYWPLVRSLNRPLFLLHGFGRSSANDYISHLLLWDFVWAKMRAEFWTDMTPLMFARRFEFAHGNIEQLRIAAEVFRNCLTFPLDRVKRELFGYSANLGPDMPKGEQVAQALDTTPEGDEFLVTAVDDFGQEVARTRQNEKLMELLDERAKKPGSVSMDEVKKKLGLS